MCTYEYIHDLILLQNTSGLGYAYEFMVVLELMLQRLSVTLIAECIENIPPSRCEALAKF